jgi:hypothetical protein
LAGADARAVGRAVGVAEGATSLLCRVRTDGAVMSMEPLGGKGRYSTLGASPTEGAFADRAVERARLIPGMIPISTCPRRSLAGLLIFSENSGKWFFQYIRVDFSLLQPSLLVWTSRTLAEHSCACLYV